MKILNHAVAAALFVLGCGEFEPPEEKLNPTGQLEQPIRFGDDTGSYPAVGKLKLGFGGLCSGTLIRPDTVLTAAHCVDGESPRTVSFLAAGRDPSYAVASIAMAPGYVRIADPNVPDIAIVRLKGSVADIEPMTLGDRQPGLGETLLGVGFGQDETNAGSGVKRSGTMIVQEKKVGQALLPSGGSFSPVILRVNPGPLSQLACPGDSGGPLLDESGSIVGVASFNSIPVGTFSDYCTSAVQAGYASVPDSADLLGIMIDGLPPAPPARGACRREGDRFKTTGGGCRHERTGLVYSRRFTKASQRVAVIKCRDSEEGGLTDWRLPAANELRAMARNGGNRFLQGGNSAQLWSRSRKGQMGTVVKMNNGDKKKISRTDRFEFYCTRGGL